MIPEQPVADAIAAYGLQGSARELPTEPLDTHPWTRFVEIVRTQRLGGLLARAVDAGAFPVTEQQYEETAQLEAGLAGVSIQLERVLLDAAAALDAEQLSYRVLKGPALAHTVYPRAASRPFGDIDLLVRSEEFDRAVLAFTDRGAVRRYAEPRPGFTRRFGKGVALVRPDGFEIDVHRTFVAGPFGLTIDLPSLFESSTPFQLGGRVLHGLEREEQFLHACYHAVLGSAHPRLIPLRDVAQLVLCAEPGLDFNRARSLWQRWRCDIVVARAVRQSWETFAIADRTAFSAWASAYVPTGAAEQAMAAYAGRGDRYAMQAVAAIRVIPGMRAKASYVHALVHPERGYLDEREGGYLARWQRGARLVRAARSR